VSLSAGVAQRLLKMGCRKAAGSPDTEAYVVRYVEVDGRPRTQRTIFSSRSVDSDRMFKRPVEQGRNERDAEAYSGSYVEALSEARTKLEGRFNIR
jgi:hypothetical protein